MAIETSVVHSPGAGVGPGPRDPSLPGLESCRLERRYPQPHMQGKRGLDVCVFEQSSGKASVVEADRWLTAASGGLR